MRQKFRQIVSILLAVSLSVGVLGSTAFAEETEFVPEAETQVATEIGQIEASGSGSAGKLIARSISQQQTENAPDESGNYIMALEIKGMTATVSYSAADDAQIIVAIYDEAEGVRQMLGSGSTLAQADSSEAVAELQFTDGIVPEYFIATAYMLDADNQEPLCEPYMTEMYTKPMQDLKNATVNDFEAEQVLNLDESSETNFAVYNEETISVDASSDINRIVDNGNGIYTVFNADETFTELEAGNKISYDYGDGEVLLITVKEISVKDSTVTIYEDSDTDLTDYFDYVKIEANSSGGQVHVDESVMAEGVAYVGEETAMYSAADETQPLASEGGGSLAHSLAFTIDKNIDKGIKFKGSVQYQFQAEVKYYLSLDYQYLSAKIDYSAGVSVDISAKAENETPLGRVEVSILPCVSLGFTPSFVVEASAKIAWKGEWKGALGFSYDSVNKIQNLCQNPTSSSRLEFSGKIFVGIKATPYVAIITADLCKASLETQAGIEVSAKENPYKETADSIHDCKACIQGSLNAKLSVKVSAEVVKGVAKVEATLADIKLKIKDFYFSADHSAFGWSTCPYLWYKTTVAVQDKNNFPVEGAVLTVVDKTTGEAAEYKQPEDAEKDSMTNKQGECHYFLKNGSYVFEAVAGEQSGSQEIIVHNKKNSTIIKMDDRKYPVAVTVVDTSGNPVNGVNITVFRTGENTSFESEVVTDVTGQAVLELTAGAYVLKAKNDRLKGEGEMIVGQDASNSIVLTMEEVKYGTVHLTAMYEDGTAAQGAVVAGTGMPVDPITDVNGMASFELETGTYTLHVQAGAMSGECTLNVQEGEQSVQVELLSQYRLTVRVVDEFGNPVEGAKVSGLNYQNEPTTDRDGTTVISIQPGEYSLQVYTDTLFGTGDTKIIDQDVSMIITVTEEDMFWTLNDGLLYIFGREGEMVEMPNYSSLGKEVPWHNIREKIQSIVLESNISHIGDRAFGNCYNLSSVKIYPNMVSIGNDAFMNCFNLINIELPESITDIGYSAFSDCESLVNIEIPKAITSINNFTFENCRSLETIKIPLNVTSIGASAFRNCNNLRNIEISNGVVEIGSRAFMECNNLAFIEIPDSVVCIGEEVFMDCSSLKSIKIPQNITSIEADTFHNCSSLTMIDISKNVTNIGSSAFENCSSLEKIELPEKIGNIGGQAFYKCDGLVSIEIPNSVINIGEYAFAGCKELDSIYFTGDVPTMDGDIFGAYDGIIYYPMNNSTWDFFVKWYGKRLNLQAYDPYELLFSQAVSESAENLDIFLELNSTSETETQTEIEYLLKITESEVGTGGVTESTSQDTISEEIILDIVSTESTSEETTSTDVDGLDIFMPEDSINLSDETELNETEVISEDEVIIIHESTQEVFAERAAITKKQISEFRNLIPGRAYFFAAVKDAFAEDMFSADNLVYVAQGVAESDGTIGWAYLVPETVEFATCIFGEKTENNIADATITVERLISNGIVQFPEISVKFGNKELVQNVDYRVSGDLYVQEVGTYTVTIKGIGAYCGRVKHSFIVEEEHVHSYGAPFFRWETPVGAEPTCCAYYSCLSCEMEELESVCTVTQKPSETVCGGIEYTATTEIAGKIYTDTYVTSGSHTGGAWETVKAATCTRDGEEVKKCVRCGNMMERRVITALGHIEGAWEVASAATCIHASEEVKKCVRCGNAIDKRFIPAPGHKWGAWRVQAQPTVFKAGKKTRSCSVCQMTENTAVGAKLNPTIKVNASKFPLKIKQSTTKLKVTGLAAGDSVVSWKSSNTKVVKVSGNGKIKAGKRPGKATITITLASGLTKEIKVTVQKSAVKTKKIKLSSKKLTLRKGKKASLAAEITPFTSLQKVTYTTSNPKVVAVNQKGVIKAKRKGTAKITVRSGTKKATVTVKVK